MGFNTQQYQTNQLYVIAAVMFGSIVSAIVVSTLIIMSLMNGAIASAKTGSMQPITAVAPQTCVEPVSTSTSDEAHSDANAYGTRGNVSENSTFALPSQLTTNNSTTNNTNTTNNTTNNVNDNSYNDNSIDNSKGKTILTDNSTTNNQVNGSGSIHNSGSNKVDVINVIDNPITTNNTDNSQVNENSFNQAVTNVTKSTLVGIVPQL